MELQIPTYQSDFDLSSETLLDILTPALFPEYRLDIPSTSVNAFFHESRGLPNTTINQVETFHSVYFEILTANASLVDLHHELGDNLEYIIGKREKMLQLQRQVKQAALEKIESRKYLKWMKAEVFSWMKAIYVKKYLKFSKENVNIKIYEKSITELGRKAVEDLNKLVNESDRVGRLMDSFLKNAQLPVNRHFVNRMSSKGLLRLLSATHESTGVSLKYLHKKVEILSKFLDAT